MKRMFLLVLACAGVSLADGGVAVKGIEAQQRYPWNGKVDIVVTLEGVADEVANVGCSFVATNSATQAAIPVKSIIQQGSDSGSGTTWTRRFVWNATNDVGAVKIDDLALTVDAKMLGGVQLWKNGPYWAECNVGASKPEEYGYSFLWGDTVGYKRNADNDLVSATDGSGFSLSPGFCPTYGKDGSWLLSAGYIDASGNLVAAHDAATAHLGAPWRMPTRAEIDALISNCDTKYTTRNGVYGRLVTGRGAFASKSIFLPVAGLSFGSLFHSTGSGYYWSSTPYSDNPDGAWFLIFGSSDFTSLIDYRNHWLSVRPLRGFVK